MIKIGDYLPKTSFKVHEDDAFVDQTTTDIFDGKKIVLFAVPGAFTPTCSASHMPGFVENHAEILAKGVDEIAVISVNDHHVMRAWAQDTKASDKITFLADVNGDFAKATGLEFDLSFAGLGVRSKRYAMIVENGVVTALNVEEGAGVTVSSAAAIMELL